MSMQWDLCSNCHKDVFRYRGSDTWKHVKNWRHIHYPNQCDNPLPQSETEDLPLEAERT